ncbi:MAG TPA: site-specific DNA-methyltransferase, partial [Defluviitoga tunisiensis]|nr:site-specific DNA-methyltransferase [Defluviitoga tunisiensis]
FDNIDEELDGWLIKSENYQALNTLSFKYNERIQCIYIDPPYNTNSSPIIYVNNYKHSSWLTLMQNRIEISKKLLKPNGINIVAIDDVELRYLITLLDNIFGQDNYITTITTECNPQGRVSNKVSKTTEFHILHAKNINNIQEIYVNKIGNKKPKPLKRTGTNSRREERPNRYYPILIKDNKIFMIQEEEYKNIYNATSKMFNDDFVEFIRQKYENLGYNFVLPIGENGEKLVWQRTFERVNKEKENYIVKDNSIFTPSFDKEIPKTLWKDSIFSNPEYGSEYLKHILGSSVFETPKSLHTIKQFFSIFDSKGVYLDYFGGSGTTAEAIIKLNQEDDGERKYIIVELGDHIYSVIIPRIKKICFTDKWQEGMAQDGQGVSQFFKYYELEQYEDVLRNAKYEHGDLTLQPSPGKDVFNEYIFMRSPKFVEAVLKREGNEYKVDLSKIYPEKRIDIAETLSNVLGKKIRKISKESFELEDIGKIRYDNIPVEYIKPLIWW